MSIEKIDAIPLSVYRSDYDSLKAKLSNDDMFARTAKTFVDAVDRANPNDKHNSRVAAMTVSGEKVGLHYMLGRTFRVVFELPDRKRVHTDLDPSVGLYPHDPTALDDLLTLESVRSLHIEAKKVPQRGPTLNFARFLAGRCMDYYAAGDRHSPQSPKRPGQIGRIGGLALFSIHHMLREAEK